MTTNSTFYENPFLSLDTETTGTDSYTDRVVTSSMVVMYPDGSGRENAVKEWLINPGIDIPTGASDVHGVTTEIAQASGMDPKIALQEIADALSSWTNRGLSVVIFNASFDATLLLAEFERYGIEFTGNFDRVIDPFVLDKHFEKYRKGKRTLTGACEHHGIVLTDAHSSTADAVATGLLAIKLGKQYKIDMEPEELQKVQREWKKEQALSLQEYFRVKQNQPDALVHTGWPVRTAETDAADAEASPVQGVLELTV